MKRPPSDEQGFGLIAVIWSTVILVFIAVSVMTLLSIETKSASGYLEREKAYYCAKAGIALVLSELLADKTPADSFEEDWAWVGKQRPEPPPAAENAAADGDNPPSAAPDPDSEEGKKEAERLKRKKPIPLGTGTYFVEVTDEGSKINLNEVRWEMLAPAFNDPDAKKYPAVLDWRDIDDKTRKDGAENDFYQQLHPPYECKNGLFDSIDELKYVKGFTPADVDALRPVLGVYGDFSPNNVDIDSVGALLKGYGFSGYKVGEVMDKIDEQRRGKGAPSLDLAAILAAAGLFPDEVKQVMSHFSAQGNINVNTAPTEVLRILCRGLSLQKVDEVVGEIDAARTGKTVANLGFINNIKALRDENKVAALTRYLCVSTTYFSVNAHGKLPSGREAVIRALIYRSKDHKQLRILSWIREDM